ncbi:hypothetical protein IV203_002633 [Nitzschia inconspicua]|uniref:Uncharacterized protein n=1 Tax=Nitzschia inconspicua TaxID=303405 RepID=A0A9K3K759_9STRA|nr:hypothetical protein IV203_002633 [Nitzschia inconspicua]
MDDNYFLFSIPAEPSTRNDDPVIGAENRIVDASLHRRNDDTENFDDIERYLETILHDDDGPLEIEDGSPSTKYSPERDDDNNDIIIVPIPPFNNGIDESRDPTAFLETLKIPGQTTPQILLYWQNLFTYTVH